MLFQFVSFSPKLDSIPTEWHCRKSGQWITYGICRHGSLTINYHDKYMSGLRGSLIVYAKMRCQSINYLYEIEPSFPLFSRLGVYNGNNLTSLEIPLVSLVWRLRTLSRRYNGSN